MNKLEQAARQALEALESAPVQYDFNSYPMLVMTPDTLQTTLTALREALKEQAEQEPVAWRWPTHNGYAYAETHFDGEGGEPLYAAPVRTKDLTEPLIDELRECRDLLMCVESCSRNNFENLAYERVQAIDEVIAADRRKNK